MAFGYDIYFSERPRNRVVRWSPDTGDVQILAGEPPDGDQTQKLAEPYGLAFDRDGHLLIADKFNNRICRLINGRLEAIALKDLSGHRARQSDSYPGYDPALRSPTGLCVERDGSLLCTFSDDYVIYRIRPKGEVELVLGIPRNRPYLFSGIREIVPSAELPNTPLDVPTGIVGQSDGTLFFIERKPQVVREYHPARGLRCVFPLRQQGGFAQEHEVPLEAPLRDSHLGIPTALALDAEQRLHVCDTLSGCILRVEPTEDRVTKVLEIRGDIGSQPAGPVALGFGPDGTAWVLDTVRDAIEAYETNTGSRWRETGVRLTEIRGQSLQNYPCTGSSLVVGPALRRRTAARSKVRR